jgi:hypothetical protein
MPTMMTASVASSRATYGRPPKERRSFYCLRPACDVSTPRRTAPRAISSAAATTASAIYGRGVGPQGNVYAIPTKDRQLRVLPLQVIRAYVGEFLDYARRQPNISFELTPIGCGLAGYTRTRRRM